MNQTFVPRYPLIGLTRRGFAEWSRDLGLRPQALAVIGRIRSLPPARRVQGRAGNLISFYPSLKMGHTVQAESGTVELPAIYVYEHDPEGSGINRRLFSYGTERPLGNRSVFRILQIFS